MRWTAFFVLCVSIAEAAVPASLSGSFQNGLTFTAGFGSTTIRDDSTTTTDSISDAPVLSIVGANNDSLAGNTVFTVVLLDISGSPDPSAAAVLRYAASNLRAPPGFGGILGGGVTPLAYQPPSGNAELVFLAFIQPDGDLQFDAPADPGAFNLADFRSANELGDAVAGFGFTVEGPNTSTTSSSISPEPTAPSNSTTTTSSSTSRTEKPRPPPLVTSTYTLSRPDGGVTTVVTVVPGPEPTAPPPPPPSTTTDDPSLITNDPNAGSQNIVSKSTLALLAFSAFFVAFA